MAAGNHYGIQVTPVISARGSKHVMVRLGDAGAMIRSMAGKRKTILILDDVEMVRVTVSKMALRLGMQPIVVPNPKEFSPNWAENDIDIVLTDVFMPGRSGLDVISEVNEAYPDVPVVAMSGGWRDDQDKADALRAAVIVGACKKVLEKPFTAQEFEDTMRELDIIP